MTELPELFDDLIESIAKEHLPDVKNLDDFDYPNVAVWEIKEALKYAFFAGVHYGANVGKSVVGELK